MAIRKISRTQNDAATWVADSGGIATNIERVGLITRVDTLVEVTPSATLTGANQPHGLFRLIQNLRFEGSIVYGQLPGDDGCMGGTLLHYLNQQDGFGVGHASGSVSAPVSAYTNINYRWHWGSRPKNRYGVDNPFDLTAFIPAFHESQLTATWITSGNDVMDDGVTISSAVMRFLIHRVIGTEAEIREEMVSQGVNLPHSRQPVTGVVPQWSSVVHANLASTSDFDAESVDVPVGAFLKRINMLFQDATASRTLVASDQVSEVRLHHAPTNETLIQINAEAALLDLPAGTNLTANSGASESAGTEIMGADFNGHAPAGILTLDMRKLAQSAVPERMDYGMDMRGAQSGDFKLGFIIDNRAAGDDTLINYERYGLYGGPLSPVK